MRYLRENTQATMSKNLNSELSNLCDHSQKGKYLLDTIENVHYKVQNKNRQCSLYLTSYGATEITFIQQFLESHPVYHQHLSKNMEWVPYCNISTYQWPTDFHFQAMTRSHHNSWGTNDNFPNQQTTFLRTSILLKLN